MDLELRLHNSITEVDRSAWNRLALAMRAPFYEWEWLALLEASGSIAPQTGWQPLHLTIGSEGRFLAALPLYLKNDSQGEFVFDYGWADVAEQLNIPYYPKLVGTSPATPSGFYGLMRAPEEAMEPLTSTVLDHLDELADRAGIGGLSFLFSNPQFGERLRGFYPWVHQSYLWLNRGYESFDDYLGEFGKNQRRNIRREWASLTEQGLTIRALTGDELTPALMNRMYSFYLHTNAKFGPWAARFLNEEFFLRLPGYLGHRTVLFAAVPSGRQADEAVGISLCLHKGDWLYGRYWGADEGYPNLHFNACYYAPIRWMIDKRIRYFDPGMGSPHKLRRGFFPHRVASFHHFYNRSLQGLFESTMEGINGETDQMIRQMEERVPYRSEVKKDMRAEIDRLFF